MKNLGTKKLETKHLVLRKFEEKDCNDVFNNYASDSNVTKFLTWDAHENLEVSKEYLSYVLKSYDRPDVYHWAIELKQTGEVIGAVSSVRNDDTCAEIGYCLGLKYWNKGYMTEAVVEVVRYFFEEVGFKTIFGKHVKENFASGEVMKKAGLKWIGEGEEKGEKVYIYLAKIDDYKQLKIEYLLNKIYKAEINNYKYYTFGYQQEYRKNEQVCYGYLPFIDSIKPELIVDIISDKYKYNRPGVLKESTEYITIHDTASAAPSAGTKAHNNWIHSMANDSENRNSVSWHYTIGDKDIYQHIPLDEVAYHAGDGTGEKLEFIDTGIKASRDMKLEISTEGKYLINGIDTNVCAPLDSDGNVPTNENIPYNGIAVRVNEKGNFSIGKTWWSKSYKMIGNRGGNLNSVGIETCVNVGSNYINTMRNTANVVGKLLNKYDLSVDRVKQHNFFSGKNCPMTIREAGLWEEFIEIVKLEKYRNDYLSDVEFKFTSLTPELLSDDGNIIKHVSGEKVMYKVEVTSGKEKYEYKFTSRLLPLTF